jgi:plasmid stabilization system protein ParE
MKRYRVVVTPFAAANIREAHAWYRAENPAAADKWLAGIEKTILGLATLPECHALAPESAAFATEIRQVLCGAGGVSWRIFISVRGSTVRVLHVRHGRRDYWRP